MNGFERGFITKPAVKALLRTWPDVEADTEAVEKSGPRQCCAEYGSVERCDGTTDVLRCPVCETQWTRPCVGDDGPAVEV